MNKEFDNLKCKFGCTQPIRFLDEENVTAYNSNGKEMIIPKCKKCNVHMAQLIGQTSSTWLCNMCGGQ